MREAQPARTSKRHAPVPDGTDLHFELSIVKEAVEEESPVAVSRDRLDETTLDDAQIPVGEPAVQPRDERLERRVTPELDAEGHDRNVRRRGERHGVGGDQQALDLQALALHAAQLESPHEMRVAAVQPDRMELGTDSPATDIEAEAASA